MIAKIIMTEEPNLTGRESWLQFLVYCTVLLPVVCRKPSVTEYCKNPHHHVHPCVGNRNNAALGQIDAVYSIGPLPTVYILYVQHVRSM